MLDAQHRFGGSSVTALSRLLNPIPYIRAFIDVWSLLVRKRALTFEMAKREISSEHSGKALGMFWGILQPLFILAVYAVVYGVVFRAKIGGTVALPLNFTIYLLSGLVPWFAFSFAMAKGTSAVSGNASLVKVVVFDLDVLPIGTALASCLSLLLGIGFIGLYTLVDYHHLPWTYALLPVLLLLQFLAMCGVAYVLSALGVFLKDVRDVVQLSALVLIFLMPIVYLPTQVPAAFNPVLWLNPFTYMVYCYQDVLYFGRIAHPASWLAFLLWSLFVFAGGYRLFRRVRPYFGNVL
jgi:lipopolysaccharide transport system permease protein